MQAGHMFFSDLWKKHNLKVRGARPEPLSTCGTGLAGCCVCARGCLSPLRTLARTECNHTRVHMQDPETSKKAQERDRGPRLEYLYAVTGLDVGRFGVSSVLMLVLQSYSLIPGERGAGMPPRSARLREAGTPFTLLPCVCVCVRLLRRPGAMAMGYAVFVYIGYNNISMCQVCGGTAALSATRVGRAAGGALTRVVGACGVFTLACRTCGTRRTCTWTRPPPRWACASSWALRSTAPARPFGSGSPRCSSHARERSEAALGPC